jgi:hypothetical protein
MKGFSSIGLLGLLSLNVGCSEEPIQKMETIQDENTKENTTIETEPEENSHVEQETYNDRQENEEAIIESQLCNGELISVEAVEQMLVFTSISDEEDIHSIYNRIDGIATLFERCGDPWGMFPTTYRHITNRIIDAIERQEIEDQKWGRDIVVDFAARYLSNLEAVLTDQEPSYAWEQYYYLADNEDVSRTRAMVAHLTLDLPYAMVEIGTTEDHKDDYFVLGELMIEITPDFIDDLRFYYDTDAEDILNGFFMGDWVDGVYGADTTITLSYKQFVQNRGTIDGI